MDCIAFALAFSAISVVTILDVSILFSVWVAIRAFSLRCLDLTVVKWRPSYIFFWRYCF